MGEIFGMGLDWLKAGLWLGKRFGKDEVSPYKAVLDLECSPGDLQLDSLFGPRPGWVRTLP